MKENQTKMMKEMKIIVSQKKKKSFVETLTSKMDHVEDRIAGLEDRIKTQEHSVKLIFAIIFEKKTL